MFGYDDCLDAFGVHAVGGIVGALLTGVFARAAISKPGLHRRQRLSGGAPVLRRPGHLIYDAVVTLIILFVIKAVMGLRVSEEVERDGLDLSLHGEVVPVRRAIPKNDPGRDDARQASGRGGNPALSLPLRPRFARTGASLILRHGRCVGIGKSGHRRLRKAS